MDKLLKKIEYLKEKMDESNYKYNEYRKYVVETILLFEENINSVLEQEEMITYLAILYLYNNESEKSLDFFEKAYKKCKNLQTSTNLACFYLKEEEDEEKAIEVLSDLLKNEVNSHIPYSLMAECYFKQKKYVEMEINLKKAMSLNINYITVYNMAVSLFYQEKYDDAIKYFNESFEYADNESQFKVRYNIAVCNLFLGKKEVVYEQIKYLENYDIDELDVAKLYLLLEDYSKAYSFYKNLDLYPSPNWVSEKIYCLHKINEKNIFQRECDAFFNEKNIEKENNLNDIDFSLEYEKNILQEIFEFNSNIEKIKKNKFLPDTNFEFYIESTCYFFGCIQHKNKYNV